jgi:hypothetical protein
MVLDVLFEIIKQKKQLQRMWFLCDGQFGERESQWLIIVFNCDCNVWVFINSNDKI